VSTASLRNKSGSFGGSVRRFIGGVHCGSSGTFGLPLSDARRFAQDRVGLTLVSSNSSSSPSSDDDVNAVDATEYVVDSDTCLLLSLLWRASEQRKVPGDETDGEPAQCYAPRRPPHKSEGVPPSNSCNFVSISLTEIDDPAVNSSGKCRRR
jgi:hypothetical protein